jgi:hypothetical protein
MTNLCTDPRCPCRNTAEDEERPYVPARPKVGRPMPPNFRERVWADLKHRREQRQHPEATP